MRTAFVVAALLLAFACPSPLAGATSARSEDPVTEGRLIGVDAAGAPRAPCPLKHTDVNAEITGFVARITVTQQFENPFDEAIEAVYMFPLAGDAAVDRMTMRIGDREITGKIARRDEARATYETARAEGKTASLLEQERPNLFVQSVANILPKAQVEIRISYVQTLTYEDGVYEFVFPLVAGKRYNPAGTDKFEAPAVAALPAGVRAGHDVSINVAIDAGVPMTNIGSTLHQVSVEQSVPERAVVRLANKDEIPNRDFILKYGVAGAAVDDAFLTHRDDRGGFFTFILQPPARVATQDVTPKEIVFVLDTSGSMSGFPMEKAKETIRYALDNLYPDDTFNLVTFAGDTRVLFKQPVPASDANRETAMKLLASTQGSGGTEMMTAVNAALAPSDRQDHVRIVCFLTDGYVGNDMEILDAIQKHPNARVFSFGIGDAVNRFLLDKMADEGRGEATYVTLDDDGSAAAKKFFERVRNPLLTDVSIDWNGLDVKDVLPARIPDLFSARPVVVTGRYDKAANGTIRLRGRSDGREFTREIVVDLPSTAPEHDALATIWARRRVDDLMRSDWAGVLKRAPRDGIDEQITALGLSYGLLTQFTSFVAVDDKQVTAGGDPKRVGVATEAPEGTLGETVEVTAGESVVAVRSLAELPISSTKGKGRAKAPRKGGGKGSGVGRGSGSGVGPGDGWSSGGGSPRVGGGDAPAPPPAAPKDGPGGVPGGVAGGVSGGVASGVSGSRSSAAPVAVDRVDHSLKSVGETVTVVGGGSGVATADARMAAVANPMQPKPAVLAAGAHPAAPWTRNSAKPAVELVFAIDTTGSMSGLIESAKRRIWGIVNEIQRSGCHPDVRIGIVAYRDRGDDYETLVLPLTTDLDLVYQTLMSLNAGGGGDGPENVRRGLADALNLMGWSPAAPDVAQTIFLVGDAPPHDDYANEPDTAKTSSAAANRGIVVHAIQCGADANTKSVWEMIARNGSGQYFAVPADGAVPVAVRTPYDDALTELGRKLGSTYTPYGSLDSQKSAAARQEALEREVASGAGRATAADRAVNKAVNSLAYSEDFLQAVENGDVKLSSVPQSELPEDLRGISPEALQAEVDRRIARRKNLRATVLDLARLRDEFIEDTVKDGGAADRNAFDRTVGDAVKDHLKRKGAKCE